MSFSSVVVTIMLKTFKFQVCGFLCYKKKKLQFLDDGATVFELIEINCYRNKLIQGKKDNQSMVVTFHKGTVNICEKCQIFKSFCCFLMSPFATSEDICSDLKAFLVNGCGDDLQLDFFRAPAPLKLLKSIACCVDALCKTLFQDYKVFNRNQLHL